MQAFFDSNAQYFEEAEKGPCIIRALFLLHLCKLRIAGFVVLNQSRGPVIIVYGNLRKLLLGSLILF